MADAEMQPINFRPEMNTITLKCQGSIEELLSSLSHGAQAYAKKTDVPKPALLLLATIPLHLAARGTDFSTAAEQAVDTRHWQARGTSSRDRLGAAWTAGQLTSLSLLLSKCNIPGIN